MLDVQLLSADTFGRLDNIAAQLGVRAKRLEAGRPEAAQKAAVVRQLGGERVVAIGNGANDADMLGETALGIGVVGPEGLAAGALAAADVVAPSINDALGLLRNPKRLIATLRR
jgi:soluble P-type ATPase